MAGTYDPNKDVCFKKWEHQINPDTRVEIGIYKYDTGAKKVRVTRFVNGKVKEFRDVVCKIASPELGLILEHIEEIGEAMK